MLATQPPDSPPRSASAAPADIAALLTRIDERLARVERALDRAEAVAASAPGLVATALDTVDSLAERARGSGIDLDERIRTLLRVLERLTAPEALSAVELLLHKMDTIKAVLESGALDPRALATVATAGDALAKAAHAPPSRMSLWGAFRAASDPEVQAALAFFVRFAHAFGEDLHETPPERRLAAPSSG